MIIIEENTLIHVDSSSDVIEHYGVKGMKWGVRRAAKASVGYGKAVGRTAYNNLRHPILSGRALQSSYRRSGTGTYFGTKRSLDYRNNYVKDRVAGKKKLKSDIRTAKAKGKAGKLTKARVKADIRKAKDNYININTRY